MNVAPQCKNNSEYPLLVENVVGKNVIFVFICSNCLNCAATGVCRNVKRKWGGGRYSK